MWSRLPLCLTTMFCIQVSLAATNDCIKRKAKSCSECMEVPGCGWCEDVEYANNPNIIVSRCDLSENLLTGECPAGAIVNPPSVVKNVKNDPHSSVGESDIGEATQLRPQIISANLRPGSPTKIEISYYNSLIGQVVLDLDVPDFIEVVDQESHCTTGTQKGLKCDSVKIGDVVNFTLSIKTDRCFAENKQMNISIIGYNDEVVVDISTLCDCQCNNYMSPANNCSGHGAYECGACVCDPEYLGLDCSCVKKDFTSVEKYLQNCLHPGTESVCSNRGECLCGQCICKQFTGRKIDGQYCECDNTSCDRINGQVCNGHGLCDCGDCVCEKGWSGDACDCVEDKSTCIDLNVPESGHCHGAGACKCGMCECNVTKSPGFEYRGQYCQISPQQLCNIHRECVQCLAYGDRKELCDCGQYKINLLNGATSKLRGNCRAVDTVTDCTYEFWYEKKGETIHIDTDPETQVCLPYTNPKYIIIGIIAAIVVIGLAILVILKLLTSKSSIKDSREYELGIIKS